MDINKLIEEVTNSVIKEMGNLSSVQKDDNSPNIMDMSYAKYIDHTVLKPDTVKSTVKRFCDEAKQWNFASVCVNPTHVKFVSEQLKDSNVKICCVIGFPLGANTTFVKSVEAMEAIKNGAQEVDMVINIGAIKDKDFQLVFEDIKAVVGVAYPKAIVKVIIETCLLNDEEKVKACELAKLAGADFVKTSTGFGSGGATPEDIALMRKVVGETMGVKASSGIDNREICDKMIAAGATRMGTSKGIKIINGEDTSDCLGCGKCEASCPTGNVLITKNSY